MKNRCDYHGRPVQILKKSADEERLLHQGNVDKTAFTKKSLLMTSNLSLDLRKKPIKCYIWSERTWLTDEQVLRTVAKKRLIRNTVLWRKAYWFEHTWKKLPAADIIKVKLEATPDLESRRRRIQLLEDLKKNTGYWRRKLEIAGGGERNS